MNGYIQQNSKIFIQYALYGIIFLVCIVFILIIVAVLLKFKKMREEKEKEIEINNVGVDVNPRSLVTRIYTKQSIYDFMEFDKIDDNMIVQKKGKKFLMIVECQGINYDLMSNVEKNSVEIGFLEFLNTLRNPIQIYIQTRTVNLETSIGNYRSRIRGFEEKLIALRNQYKDAQVEGNKEEMDRLNYEILKQQNLCEYAKDVVEKTELMSLNKDVLSKKYYIVVPYIPSDLGSNNFAQEEIQNIAFSELYTRCQGLIRSLAPTGVEGRILDSSKLLDLLYVAYNRDGSEVYGINKALKAGYDELYSTAQDVLDKKIANLNKEIEDRAIEKANAKVLEVETEKEKKVKKLEKDKEKLINELAKEILEENKDFVGAETAETAIKKIDKEMNKQEEKGKEGDKNETKQTKRQRKN